MLPGIYDTFQHWGNQTVWIYSDPHFSDEDLECGIKNRPSDEEQIAIINSCAGRKDTLIILGDVGNLECVRKLRAAYKVLIQAQKDPDTVDKFRRIEHARWVRFYSYYNWSYGETHSSKRREDPKLREYDTLTDYEKKYYDRAWNLLGEIAEQIK
jgi:hypothetical protein